ncbi:uncharacterized protein LOC123204929 [Mangifera indica]|uniref:uncharacterized protein LOC123204929 n=1 Tax=Mangifera indica TaxID=29780 RepID=UPI001CFA7629|nr:uncharacterized protein LOC123204929 [Mangifera indica]
MDPSSFLHLSTDSLAPPPYQPPPPPPSLAHHHHHHLPPPPLASSAATIANPTPPSVNHNNNHPPYTEMISSAITALKEKDGSSKRAIAKYIEKVYANVLPPNHSALLTHHLKRLKNTGQLVMVKKSYKLPRSDDVVASSIPPESINVISENATAIGSTHGPKAGRGRGRPPKVATTTSDSVLASLGLVDQPKRGRGRPRKGDVVVVAAAVAPRGPMKGKGRPPKAKKRGPGRPKKPKSLTGKLGPGRPPKVQVQAQAQPQPQAQEQVLNPVVVTYDDANAAMTNLARPRGRPKKIGGTTMAGDGAVKQRGRPSKKGVSSTGRPVGRPKKNPSGASTETAGAAAIGDLKRKLELFQTKVRQAVSVLKPHLTSENQISALAAIQELEVLAVMDISTQLKDDTQVAQPPPPPAPQQHQQQQPQLPLV